MAHIYNLETGAWIQDPTDGWVSSKVVSKNIVADKATLVFQITSGSREGQVRFFAWKSGSHAVPVRGNKQR